MLETIGGLLTSTLWLLESDLPAYLCGSTESTSNEQPTSHLDAPTHENARFAFPSLQRIGQMTRKLQGMEKNIPRKSCLPLSAPLPVFPGLYAPTNHFIAKISPFAGFIARNRVQKVMRRYNK